MRKQILFFSGFLTLIIFFFAGCGKDNNPPVVAKTNTQLLTQASWRFQSATVNGSDWTSVQACQKDNIYTFAAAGTGTVDEGATKCNSGDPQTTSFTWNFQSAESILFVSAPLVTGSSTTLTLVSLTETQLVVSGATTGPGPSFQFIITFSH